MTTETMRREAMLDGRPEPNIPESGQRQYVVSVNGDRAIFTSYGHAGRYFRKLRREGHAPLASTWMQFRDSRTRLDASGQTPEWAWNPHFRLAR